MVKTIVNLGAGSHTAFRYLDPQGPPAGWKEIKVDLDPSTNPDVIASLTDLRGAIEDASADVVYSSHAIEHIADHEVEIVLSEMHRILRNDGFVALRCPDLGQLIDRFDPEHLEKPIYHSPVGPISVLDILYGHRESIAEGQEFMRHRTGFTEKSLADRLLSVGFKEIRIQPGESCDMVVIASINTNPDLEIAASLFPDMDFNADGHAAVDWDVSHAGRG